MSIIESLPERPLTIPETQHLTEQDDETRVISPLSVLKTEQQAVLASFSVYLVKPDMLCIFGYSAAQGGWEVIEMMDELRDDYLGRQKEIVLSWAENALSAVEAEHEYTAPIEDYFDGQSRTEEIEGL